jgi:hypothetical protein
MEYYSVYFVIAAGNVTTIGSNLLLGTCNRINILVDLFFYFMKNITGQQPNNIKNSALTFTVFYIKSLYMFS